MKKNNQPALNKLSRLTVAQLAISITVAEIIIMSVYSFVDLRILALPISAIFIYSFILLTKSMSISDMLVSFFAYLTNMFILILFFMTLFER